MGDGAGVQKKHPVQLSIGALEYPVPLGLWKYVAQAHTFFTLSSSPFAAASSTVKMRLLQIFRSPKGVLRIQKSPSYEVRSSTAFTRYIDWCKENNYNAENIKNFKNAMQTKYFFERRRPKDGGEKTTVIIGCRLRKEELGAETEDGEALSE